MDTSIPMDIVKEVLKKLAGLKLLGKIVKDSFKRSLFALYILQVNVLG
jgi:hypothetical protein